MIFPSLDWWKIFCRCLLINSSFCLLVTGVPGSFAESNALQRNLQTIGNKLRSRLHLSHECTDVIELCMTFLGEKTPLPQQLKQDFQTSGITHLIAISAGQIAPLLACGTFFVGLVVFLSVGAKRFVHYKNGIFKLWQTTLFLTVTFSAAFFGLSGALLRLPTVWFFEKIWKHINIARPVSNLSVGRWLGYSILCCFIPRPFEDLSFALSALGAETVSFVYSLRDHAPCITLNAPKGANSAGSAMSNFITAALGAMVGAAAVSLLMSLFLLPFTFNTFSTAHSNGNTFRLAADSVFGNLQSNFLAVPLVTFIVAPLAFLKLIFSGMTQFFEVADKSLLFPLDPPYYVSLQLLKAIAETFSSGQSAAFSDLLMASKKGYFMYLILFFISVKDVRSCQRINRFRRQFLLGNKL